MATFHAYYWFNPMGHSRSICEPLEAEDMDAACEMVQQRLNMNSFVFDATKEGRVVVVTAHVQYVEIEAEGAPDPESLPLGMNLTEDILQMHDKIV